MVFLLNCMLVCIEDMFAAGKCGNKDQQGALRCMEVRKHLIDYGELKTGSDEQVRGGILCFQQAGSPVHGTLERSDAGSTDCNYLPSFFAQFIFSATSSETW